MLRTRGLVNNIRRKLTLTLNSNTLNYNLYNAALFSFRYKPGRTDLVFINNAVIGSSTSSGSALLIPNNFRNGDRINIINNNLIIGKGGNGGNAGTGSGNGGAGETVSGAAINAAYPIRIENNGTVAGGGGGGGGGAGGRR